MKTIMINVNDKTWNNFKKNAKRCVNMTPEQYVGLLVMTRANGGDFLTNFQEERGLPDWVLECFIGVKGDDYCVDFFKEVIKNRTLYGMKKEEKMRLEM